MSINNNFKIIKMEINIANNIYYLNINGKCRKEE